MSELSPSAVSAPTSTPNSKQVSLAKNLNILLSNSQSRLKQLQIDYDALTNDHTELQRHHTTLHKEHQKSIERCKHNETDYRTQIQLLTTQNAQLTIELNHKLQSSKDELTLKYDKQLSTLTNQYDELYIKHQSLNDRHSKLIDTNQRLQHDIENQSDQYNHKLHECNQRIEQLTKQLSHTNNTQADVESKLSQTKNDAEQSMHQLKTLRGQVAELEDNQCTLVDKLAYADNRYSRLELKYDAVARQLSDQRHSIHQFRRIIRYCAIVSFVRSYQAKKLCFSTYSKLQSFTNNRSHIRNRSSVQYSISQSAAVKKSMLELVDLVDSSIESLFDSLLSTQSQNQVEKHNSEQMFQRTLQLSRRCKYQANKAQKYKSKYTDMKCLAQKLLHNSNMQYQQANAQPTKRLSHTHITDNTDHNTANIHHNSTHTRGISLFNHRQSTDWTNIMQTELDTLAESDQSDDKEDELTAMLEISKSTQSQEEKPTTNRAVTSYVQSRQANNSYHKPTMAPNSLVASDFRHTLRSKSASASHRQTGRSKLSSTVTPRSPLQHRAMTSPNRSHMIAVHDIGTNMPTLSDKLDHSPYISNTVTKSLTAKNHTKSAETNQLHVLNGKNKDTAN